MPIPKGAVQRHLEEVYGGQFTTRERVVSVATTAGVLLKNNPERIGWVIINTGNIQVTCRTSRIITAGEGLIIAQAGDTMTSNVLEDGNFPVLELSAIAAAAGGEVIVYEFIREAT